MYGHILLISLVLFYVLHKILNSRFLPLDIIIKIAELYVCISEILIRTMVIRHYYITVLCPRVL